jgi:hypothetical protein
MSSATINHVYMYLCSKLILILLSIYPEVVWLNYIGVLFLIFWGIFVLISIVTGLIYIPTSSE